MRLPRFSDLQGTYYTLPALPPCHFTGMNTQLFPLRANLDTLQQFTNRYVNIIPRELGWFRAFMPYVYFGVIDYGKMASSGSNVGWLSQHEVIFSVPLEWYRLEGGEWVFQDWCWLTPFIFVDSETSLTLGRTVWGWPKSLIQVVPNQAASLGSPSGNSPLLRMASWVFPEAYAGRKQELRIFCEINREPAPSFVRVPPSPENPFLPWNIAASLFGGTVGFLDDCMVTASGLARSPAGTSLFPDNVLTMAQRLTNRNDPGQPGVAFNTVCLKQFRHSASPEQYCYQALTFSQMQVTSFNQGGLLGDGHVLLGDQSGGYSIDLWNWPSLPIVDTLGLDVAERWQDGEVERVRLRPVLPIWYDVNMIYNLGHNIAWRSFERTWHDLAGRHYPPLNGYTDPSEALYNTATGAAGQALTGPFYFPSATLRVLPLLARRAALDTFLDRYMNSALLTAGQRFRVWAPDDSDIAYVYAVAIHYGPMASESNDIGDWANYNLTFQVPVIREERVGDRWEICDVGVVPAFTFVDTTTAAISSSEVFGIPATRGQFFCPSSVWMTPEGLPPDPQQPLLRVAVELLPAMDEGQKVVSRVITEIYQSVGTRQAGEAMDGTKEDFCRLLVDELTRKYTTKAVHGEDLKHARALSLSLLADGSAIKHYTLKQFRDVTQPDRACYQSLTCIETTINEVFLIKEMELPVRMRIHEYPSQPLVKLLGLIYLERQVGDGAMVYTLEPLRPFWVHAAMTDALGTRILFRAGDSEWRDRVLVPGDGNVGVLRRVPGQHHNKPADVPLPVALDRLLSDVPPLRLKSLLMSFRSRLGEATNAAPAISREDKLRAIQSIDPQMVIESVLSREWEDRTEQARWWPQRQRMARELRDQLHAALPSRRAAVRRSYILEQLQRTESLPFQPDVHNEVLLLLEALEDVFSVAKKFEALCESYRKLIESGPKRGDSAYKKHDATLRQGCEILRELLRRQVSESALQIGYRLEHLDELGDQRLRLKDEDPAHSDLHNAALVLRIRQKEVLEQILGLLRSEGERLLSATLDKLAKGWQKPDFCVRRDTAAGDRDRIFPRELSWAEDWFVGWRHS